MWLSILSLNTHVLVYLYAKTQWALTQKPSVLECTIILIASNDVVADEVG